MATPPHLHPSAVDLGVETGDRIDRLERNRRLPNDSSSGGGGGTNWIAWSRGLDSGEAVTVGRVLLPAGASKMTIAANFTAFLDTVLISVDGLDPDDFFGSLEVGSSTSTYQTVGVVILPRAIGASVIIAATTGDDSPISSARGCVIVEPLPSTP